MSYEPTEWQNGDVITAEKLNKIENGIANGNRLILYEVDSYNPEVHTYYLDKECTQLLGSTNYFPSSDSEAIQYYNKTADILNSASAIYISRIANNGTPIQNDLLGPISVYTHHTGYGEQGPNEIRIYLYLVGAYTQQYILIEYNSYD